MSDDLIERFYKRFEFAPLRDAELLADAAERIEALQAEVKRLQSAFNDGHEAAKDEYREENQRLQAENKRLTETVHGQLLIIKSLTAGCEDRGLDGTTPVIAHIGRLEAGVERLKADADIDEHRKITNDMAAEIVELAQEGCPHRE